MMSVKSLGFPSRFKGSAYHGVFNNKCRHHDATQLTTSENHNNVAAMAQRVGITLATAVGNFHNKSLALSIIIFNEIRRRNGSDVRTGPEASSRARRVSLIQRKS